MKRDEYLQRSQDKQVQYINKSYKCCSCQHRGGLKESLETELDISTWLACVLVHYCVYVFYAYDERINCRVYIIYNIEDNIGFPTWLHVYETKDDYLSRITKYK